MRKAVNTTTKAQFNQPDGIELIKSFDRFILLGISLIGIVVLAAAFFFFNSSPVITLIIALCFSVIIILKAINISRMTEITEFSTGNSIPKENLKHKVCKVKTEANFLNHNPNH
jgi:hypothetical protein